MANQDTFDMTLPASEIDAALIRAKNAVTHEPQTLTEEQKAQARENIGAGLALIDLDTYGMQPINLILGSLFQQGGGKMEGVDLGNLMVDLCTDKPVCMKFTFGENVPHVYGVTAVRYRGQCVQLCANIMITHQTTTYMAYVTIFAPDITNPSNGYVSLKLEPLN